MKKVAILTDSSAYLPDDILQSLDIHVVPLTLHWDGESYYDGVDIQAEAFYDRLANSNTIPTTSQVTVSEFDQVFKDLLEKDFAVLALLISSGISGTVESAMKSLENFPGAPLVVMDSRLVSMALGFMVMAAARAAQEGANLAECQALAEAVYPKIGVYFTVDTLKYLNKGGRINTAKRLLGSALNIKPLLEIRDGKIELVESVISRKKAMNRMLTLVEQGIAGREPVRISTFHAAAPEDNAALMRSAEAQFSPVETVTTFVSPVVGSHTGPGTLSLAYMAG
jgi:DegV family protein with EDD domain